MNQNTVFWQLYFAIVESQGGTTNLRRIMLPLFDPEIADEQTHQLYEDAQANHDEAQIVAFGVKRAGLVLPDAPVVLPDETVPHVDPVEPVN